MCLNCSSSFIRVSGSTMIWPKKPLNFWRNISSIVCNKSLSVLTHVCALTAVDKTSKILWSQSGFNCFSKHSTKPLREFAIFNTSSSASVIFDSSVSFLYPKLKSLWLCLSPLPFRSPGIFPPPAEKSLDEFLLGSELCVFFWPIWFNAVSDWDDRNLKRYQRVSDSLCIICPIFWRPEFCF